MVQFNVRKKEILKYIRSNEGTGCREVSDALGIKLSNASWSMYRYTWFGYIYRKGKYGHYRYYTKSKGRRWLERRGL